jgi:hypothetical protein
MFGLGFSYHTFPSSMDCTTTTGALGEPIVPQKLRQGFRLAQPYPLATPLVSLLLGQAGPDPCLESRSTFA